MFAQNKDYDRLIKIENLNVITSSDFSTLRSLELKVQEEISSYLRRRFNVVELFKGFELYIATKIYTVNSLISYPDIDGNLYSVLTETLAGETPVTNPEKFTLNDTRNQQLLSLFIDVVLYHAHARINARNTPDFRITRYREAIEWLVGVNEDTVYPDFPILLKEPITGLGIDYGQTGINENTY